jgi:hypothetical protein
MTEKSQCGAAKNLAPLDELALVNRFLLGEKGAKATQQSGGSFVCNNSEIVYFVLTVGWECFKSSNSSLSTPASDLSQPPLGRRGLHQLLPRQGLRFRLLQGVKLGPGSSEFTL